MIVKCAPDQILFKAICIHLEVALDWFCWDFISASQPELKAWHVFYLIFVIICVIFF